MCSAAHIWNSREEDFSIISVSRMCTLCAIIQISWKIIQQNSLPTSLCINIYIFSLGYFWEVY